MLNLLDYLSAEVNCNYLSDLKNEYYRGQVVSLLLDLETERFALSQWQESINYIFNVNESFNSIEEAKDFVLKLDRE